MKGRGKREGLSPRNFVSQSYEYPADTNMLVLLNKLHALVDAEFTAACRLRVLNMYVPSSS